MLGKELFRAIEIDECRDPFDRTMATCARDGGGREMHRATVPIGLFAAAALAIGAIGAVIQHFILFLKDIGYSAAVASQYSTILLAASLAGRVIVGHLADRFRKSYMMAFFYFLIGASVFLLSNSHSPVILWTFALVFGFSMGADYMLIPLVTAECFGTISLGTIAPGRRALSATARAAPARAPGC